MAFLDSPYVIFPLISHPLPPFTLPHSIKNGKLWYQTEEDLFAYMSTQAYIISKE